MVISVGTDLVWIPRFKKALLRRGERFLERIFTPGEREMCEKRRVPEIHLAARFAAKEATFKALGTGLSLGMRWQDVEVVGGGAEPPSISLKGEASARAFRLGVKRVLVSLTHHGDYAIAFVVATD